MPSRKRTQGKNRKKKNEARGQVERTIHIDNMENWEYNCRWGELQQAQRAEHNKNNIQKCSHGCVMPPQGHPVHNLMSTFDEALQRSNNLSGLDGLTVALERHLEVLKDTAMRKMVMNIFLSIGTNFILRENINGARVMSGTITILEHYDGEDNLGSAMSSSMSKIGYFCGSFDGVAEKDVIRFYNRRISCSCLKERYSEVKKCQDRSGRCFRCKKLTSYEILKPCTRCNYAQYCSTECHVADWPYHEEGCNIMCKLHKVAKKAKSNSSGVSGGGV